MLAWVIGWAELFRLGSFGMGHLGVGLRNSAVVGVGSSGGKRGSSGESVGLVYTPTLFERFSGPDRRVNGDVNRWRSIVCDLGKSVY
jgi:hypothetical protein